MANMYNLESVTYQAGRENKWFTAAVLGGKLVGSQAITVLPNIKKSVYLNMLGLTNKLLKADQGDCSWDPTAAVKLTEKLAEVKNYNIQLEDCVDRFESIYMVNLMKAGANNTLDSLPSDFTAATMDEIAKQVNNEIESLFVAGDSSNGDLFDGVVKVLKDSSDAVKVTGTTLTKANVLGELEKVYAAIPERVFDDAEGEVRIWVSHNTYRLIKMATAFLNSETVGSSMSISGDRYFIYGVEIIPVLGVGNDEIIAVSNRNAFLCTDLVSDFAEVELGSYPKPQENKFYVKGRMRLGACIPFEGEAVIYSK